jgi:uncharacterized protein YbjT (DUF2867 family)
VETVAHVRPDSPQLPEWRRRFEGLGARVDTTPWQPAPLAATLSTLRPEVVFALLGTTRARARRARATGVGDAGYEAIDYGLTMLLLNAARDCGSRPRFVYLSAVGARETTRNAYLAVRARVERMLRGGELPYTIVRPSFITGPDRDDFRLGERIGARVVDGVLSVLGLVGGRRLRERYRSTSNVVLAAGLVRVGLDPGYANRTVESEELR